MDLKEAAQLGGSQEDHWYYTSKARALLRCVGDCPGDRVLDIGAGTGFFARMLLRHTGAASAVCVDTGYGAPSSSTESGKPIEFRRESGAVEADIVLLMDVLEHVDDPQALLAHYARQADTGTTFIITVPAFSWLWSAHDEFLGHKRRYTLREVEKVVRTSGLGVMRGFYFFASILPAVATLRLLQRLGPVRTPRSDLQSHSAFTNRALGLICRAESAVAFGNRIGGLTAFVVARAPGRGIRR